MISDELEQKLVAVHALLVADAPLMVPPTGFICSIAPGGPLNGIGRVEAPVLYRQLDELSRAIKSLSAAIRKLDDKVKVLESANPNAGRPLPPTPFRR
jgi:hypothetical protein